MAKEITAQVAGRYELPGGAVFPESIGVDAGDVGDPAAGPDGDDESFVVEGEPLQRPALQLCVQMAGHRLPLFQGHLRQRGSTCPVRGSVPGQMCLVVEACGFVTYVTRQRANPRRRLGRSYFSVGHRQAVTG